MVPRVSCADNGRILLANQLQSSGSTFSCVSFPSFFAFQEGMWDTQISALPSSPTVSDPLLTALRRPPRWGAGACFRFAVCHLIKQPLTNPCRGRHDERI